MTGSRLGTPLEPARDTIRRPQRTREDDGGEMGFLREGRQFQVGYVTADIDAGAGFLVDTLGATRLTRFQDFRSLDERPSPIRHLAHFAHAGIEVELIEPRRDWPGSIYLDAVPGDGGGIALHHLGYLFPTRELLRDAVEEAARHGVHATVAGGAEHAAFAYLDTRAACGHFTELVYRRADAGPGGTRG